MRAADAFPTAEDVLWTCQECGAGLLLSPREAARRKFCSRDCVSAAHRQAIAAGTRAGPGGHTTDAGRNRSLENLSHDGSVAAARWQDVEPYWTPCTQCGRSFATRATSVPQYCSEACRQRAVYAEGRYLTLEKTCQVCGGAFKTSRHRPRPTCSRSCGRTLAWQQKKDKGTCLSA